MVSKINRNHVDELSNKGSKDSDKANQAKGSMCLSFLITFTGSWGPYRTTKSRPLSLAAISATRRCWNLVHCVAAAAAGLETEG